MTGTGSFSNQNSPENGGPAAGEELQARVEAALGIGGPGDFVSAGPALQNVAAGSLGSRLNLDMLMDVSLQLSVELGRARMSVRQLLDLQKGSVVELDRLAGEAVDIYVNNHLLARGDVVVVDDKFGVRITELVSVSLKGTEAG